MAKKTKRSKPKQSRTAFQKAISILKKKGLISDKVDVRTVKMTKHYKRVIKENKDVIEGKSIVVKIWEGVKNVFSAITGKKMSKAHAVAEEFAGQGKGRVRARRGKVIIENAGKLPITYNKKTGRLQTYTIDAQTKKRVKSELVPNGADFRALEAQGYKFRIYFNRGNNREADYRGWDSADEMYRDMDEYVKAGTYKNWQSFVIIIPKG